MLSAVPSSLSWIDFLRSEAHRTLQDWKECVDCVMFKLPPTSLFAATLEDDGTMAERALKIDDSGIANYWKTIPASTYERPRH